MKNWWLYVLELDDNKWYVGITSQSVEKRFNQHKSGFTGARWTKVHKPTKVFYSEDLGNCEIDRAKKYESRVTREYMNKYGFNNVRGGDLTDVVEYVRKFGYYFSKEGWTDSKYVLFMLLVIIVYSVHIYIYPFIPVTSLFK